MTAVTPDPRALPLRPPANQVDPRAVRWWQLRALPYLLVLVVAQVVGVIVIGGAAAVWLGVTLTLFATTSRAPSA